MYKVKINKANKIEIPLNIDFNSIGFESDLEKYLETLTLNDEVNLNSFYQINDKIIFNFYFKRPLNISDDYKKIFDSYQNKDYYNSFYSKLDIKENKEVKLFGINNTQFFYKQTFNQNIYNKSFFRFRYYDTQELNTLIKEEQFFINNKLFKQTMSDLPIISEHENSLVYGRSFIKTNFNILNSPILELDSNKGYFFNKDFSLSELYCTIEFFNVVDGTFSSFKENNDAQKCVIKILINDTINYQQLNNGLWVNNNTYNQYEI